jgi:hypothetical protein
MQDLDNAPKDERHQGSEEAAQQDVLIRGEGLVEARMHAQP